MGLHYILNEAGDPVPEPDVITWARWFEVHNSDRVVAFTELPNGVSVSTVFLALDHGMGGNGDPLLFETMIFNGPLDETQHRYTTRAAALKGHEYYVRMAKLIAEEPS